MPFCRRRHAVDFCIAGELIRSQHAAEPVSHIRAGRQCELVRVLARPRDAM